MIDSHCHLDHQPLFSNLSEIVKRSRDVGIQKLLTICTTLESFEKIKKIIYFDDIIYGTFGIHPHETKNNIISKEIIIKSIIKEKKIIGVGETGLDFFYNHSDKQAQIKSFEEHISASIDLNIPLIVHSRNAEEETYKILSKYKSQSPKILMHCFTGSTNFAKKLFELECYFSASGIITFKNSAELRSTFSSIPIQKILVETDSPFLAPIPLRGKKNEPSYIKYTLEKLAEIREKPFNVMDKITSDNFNKLFSLK